MRKPNKQVNSRAGVVAHGMTVQRKAPVAPLAYRPQSQPSVLQAKLSKVNSTAGESTVQTKAKPADSILAAKGADGLGDFLEYLETRREMLGLTEEEEAELMAKFLPPK